MIKPQVIDALVAAGCTVEQLAAAWKADQATSTNAERQARFRARRKALLVTDSDVTPVTKEVPQTPPENPSPKEKTLRAKKKPVSRIPDDFVPDIDWALAQGLSRAQAEMQAATFLDWWKGAKDGEKSDWPSTWRNWVRKFIEKHGITPRALKTVPDIAKAPEELEKHWLGRLEYGRVHGKWLSEQWGPAPGTEGCRVPPELLKPGDGSGWRKFESAA